MRLPEPSMMFCSSYDAPDERRRICSAALQGSRSSKQSWIALRCSGAAHPNTKHRACWGSRLRGNRVETLCSSRGSPQDDASRGEVDPLRQISPPDLTHMENSYLQRPELRNSHKC